MVGMWWRNECQFISHSHLFLFAYKLNDKTNAARNWVCAWKRTGNVNCCQWLVYTSMDKNLSFCKWFHTPRYESFRRISSTKVLFLVRFLLHQVICFLLLCICFHLFTHSINVSYCLLLFFRNSDIQILFSCISCVCLILSHLYFYSISIQLVPIIFLFCMARIVMVEWNQNTLIAFFFGEVHEWIIT